MKGKDDTNVDRAQQNARGSEIPTAVAEYPSAPGAWDGPFTVEGLPNGNAQVTDAAGSPFCYVLTNDVAGKDKSAAKARATRIAEVLNATGPQTYESSLRMPEAIARAAHITEVFVGDRRFIPEPTN